MLMPEIPENDIIQKKVIQKKIYIYIYIYYIINIYD